MDCRWTLTATGKKVIVDVMESYFEGSPGCSYDYLGIYDGKCILYRNFVCCYYFRWPNNQNINTINDKESVTGRKKAILRSLFESIWVHPRFCGGFRVALLYSYVVYFLFICSVSCAECYIFLWFVHPTLPLSIFSNIYLMQFDKKKHNSVILLIFVNIYIDGIKQTNEISRITWGNFNKIFVLFEYSILNCNTYSCDDLIHLIAKHTNIYLVSNMSSLWLCWYRWRVSFYNVMQLFKTRKGKIFTELLL